MSNVHRRTNQKKKVCAPVRGLFAIEFLFGIIIKSSDQKSLVLFKEILFEIGFIGKIRII